MTAWYALLYTPKSSGISDKECNKILTNLLNRNLRSDWWSHLLLYTHVLKLLNSVQSWLHYDSQSLRGSYFSDWMLSWHDSSIEVCSNPCYLVLPYDDIIAFSNSGVVAPKEQAELIERTSLLLCSGHKLDACMTDMKPMPAPPATVQRHVNDL